MPWAGGGGSCGEESPQALVTLRPEQTLLCVALGAGAALWGHAVVVLSTAPSGPDCLSRALADGTSYKHPASWGSKDHQLENGRQFFGGDSRFLAIHLWTLSCALSFRSPT